MYEPSLDPEDYCFGKSCYQCEQHEEKQDRLIGTLRQVIKILYHDEAIDTAKLDDYLHDLCLELKVKFPMDKSLEIMRTKRSPKIEDILSDWKEYNSKALKQTI